MPAASSDTENTDAMNRMLDLGEMPDEPIVKANDDLISSTVSTSNA
ncbi:MAG: hypothetical protein Q4E48_00505 [Prevotella sp.]|nr:hypothetical protein [Prevotella sp.]